MNDAAKAIPQTHLVQKPLNKMGRMLLESGKLSLEDLKAIVSYQEQHGLRFGDAAQQLGLVTAEDINIALADQFSYTRTPDRTSKLDKRLLAAFQPDSAHSEALRSLRSELLLRYFNQGAHLSLSLIGAEDSEGIALTSANLAIVFSQLGIRTLLIDSNLRAPQLHHLFGLNERNIGLADLLATADLRERTMAQKLVTEHEMGELFKVIAFGRGIALDPLGFAAGDRMHTL